MTEQEKQSARKKLIQASEESSELIKDIEEAAKRFDSWPDWMKKAASKERR